MIKTIVNTADIYNKGRKLSNLMMTRIMELESKIDTGAMTVEESRAYRNLCNERLKLNQAIYNSEYKKVEYMVENSPLN